MSEKPKYQINFKLSSGDLINLYADNADELAEQLSYIQGLAGQITTVSKTLNGSASHPSASSNVVAAFPGAQVTAVTHHTPAPTVAGGVDQCKHGARTYRESKPGTARPWRAWMCPTPKGTPDQCEPNFIK